ncbi:hypothetical protein [Curtobacterium sp. MCBA15_008]|uniref:hypothetical protein n=1 Tax=Curtobacterium sp. MCBA15_008 TaxID=1898736 RepID=UPI0011134072|nr:hypothetical protein [Curtobacterium sp. MCBA15_008]
MSASKYLPPFTTEERGTIAADRSVQVPVDPREVLPESEVTYADFLGDEVDEVDEVDEIDKVDGVNQ